MMLVGKLGRRIFPLEFGAFGALGVRQERVDLGLGHRVRVVYASDLHLGHWWSRDVSAQLARVCRQAGPDLILLGGDLADHPAALPLLGALVRELSTVAPVAARAGNHDERTGVARVRAAVVDGFGHWLSDDPLQKPLQVDGAVLPRARPGPRLLCAHYPDVFPAAARAGYDLVLAGHLHGGQCVLATIEDRLYPAAWAHRWHGLRFRDGDSRMIVSRGVADSFPLRFNCPREVVLCEIS
jgi:predicted MPP superfamily phosphohydrolase